MQITPPKEAIKRLLDDAARHIADAQDQTISVETRFGSAYTAIRMLADAGLQAHGHRTLPSRPGTIRQQYKPFLRHLELSHRPWFGPTVCAGSAISLDMLAISLQRLPWLSAPRISRVPPGHEADKPLRNPAGSAGIRAAITC